APAIPHAFQKTLTTIATSIASIGHNNDARSGDRRFGPSFDHLVAVGGLLRQSRFPKALNQHLKAGLPVSGSPSNPRRDWEGGIDLKHARRRLMRLEVTREMGES